MNWWQETWNPVIGCSPASPGCDNCYAARNALVRAANPYTPQYAGLVGAGGKWTGETRFVQSQLLKPLGWRKGKGIFVCSMGDLFHPSVPFEWVDKVVAIMALCPQHTFIVLTKRPGRMREYFAGDDIRARCMAAKDRISHGERGLSDIEDGQPIPLPNLWLLTTVENQAMADERIPILLDTPAAVRGVSVEPMLGPVDLDRYLRPGGPDCSHIDSEDGCCTHEGTMTPECHPGADCPVHNGKCLDWVICGGETGDGARPMHPDWPRALCCRCKQTGVPFFFKQWGAWSEGSDARFPRRLVYADGRSCGFTKEEILAEEARSGLRHCRETRPFLFARVGTKRSGHFLNGREHNELPGAMEMEVECDDPF